MKLNWVRRGYYYFSESSVILDEFRYCATFRLGFFSYWAIKVIHGEEKLLEMSADTYIKRELYK